MTCWCKLGLSHSDFFYVISGPYEPGSVLIIPEKSCGVIISLYRSVHGAPVEYPVCNGNDVSRAEGVGSDIVPAGTAGSSCYTAVCEVC